MRLLRNGSYRGPTLLLAQTGTPGLVELVACDDDHALTKLVASGQIVSRVRRVARAPRARRRPCRSA